MFDFDRILSHTETQPQNPLWKSPGKLQMILKAKLNSSKG